MPAAFFPELPARLHPTRRSVGDEQSPPDAGRASSDDLGSPTSFSSPLRVPLWGGTTNDVLICSGAGLDAICGQAGAYLYGASPSGEAIDPRCRDYNVVAVADVLAAGAGAGWSVLEACGRRSCARPASGIRRRAGHHPGARAGAARDPASETTRTAPSRRVPIPLRGTTWVNRERALAFRAKSLTSSPGSLHKCTKR